MVYEECFMEFTTVMIMSIPWSLLGLNIMHSDGTQQKIESNGGGLESAVL